MEISLLCVETGHPCWNSAALSRYARLVAEVESNFIHSDRRLIVIAGKMACDGIIENENGLGDLCAVYTEPPQTSVHGTGVEIPVLATDARNMPGCKWARPNGSFFDQSLNKFPKRPKL